jgi:hypothetical protein
MTKENDNNKLTKVSFWINLTMCMITFIVLLKSFDKNVLWKEIASSISFFIFLTFTILIFRQMTKQKVTL